MLDLLGGGASPALEQVLPREQGAVEGSLADHGSRTAGWAQRTKRRFVTALSTIAPTTRIATSPNELTRGSAEAAE
jgi:hypothetical protein